MYSVLWLLMLQLDPVRNAELLPLKNQAQECAIRKEQSEREYQSRREFAERFNRLVNALDEFAQEYNKTKGQAWPKKHADHLNKAFKSLQSSLEWRSGSGESR